MPDMLLNILATFTAPENIGTDPGSLLWMFPLLASVSIIYKATKMRVIFTGKFIKEVVILFISLSLFMVAVGIALYIIVWILTG